MKLTKDTFLLYAAKHYSNPQCLSTEEFLEDMERFKYLKRLFNKYKCSGELKERLILNHIIVLYNCFGKKATDLLFFKLEGFHEYLKPFVVFLNYMPKQILYDEKVLIESDIGMDNEIIKRLREIANVS